MYVRRMLTYSLDIVIDFWTGDSITMRDVDCCIMGEENLAVKRGNKTYYFPKEDYINYTINGEYC